MYADQKVKLLLFPCNQFLSQEPDGAGTPERVSRLSQNTMDLERDANFTMMMEDVEVNGENAVDVYQFLKYNSSLYDEGTSLCKPIKWNFQKFLVNPHGGGVYKIYEPGAKLEEIKADIDLLLSEKPPESIARAPTTGAA
eukprot:TRINITY_DN49681_c0_g1_i1.p2 TRINITY_DN49681_c0_g1~~TRINITY_DN49681_c0_g1_i1.p2  ORF type:complete len:140 (-),score=29.73 TRINITY_DN49681_c0_g1_i1:32-451(-)